MEFESLSKEKFKPLSCKQQSQVRGGDRTGAGQEVVGAEREQRDGIVWINTQYRTWTGDDVGGGTECFYGIEYYWTGWVKY